MVNNFFLKVSSFLEVYLHTNQDLLTLNDDEDDDDDDADDDDDYDDQW